MGVMRATFVSADLSGADLTGANLFKADFSHATLAGARLTRANLSNSELVQTDLTRADLTGAKLAKANLDGADFTGAVGVDRDQGTRPGPATATRRSSMRNDLTLQSCSCCSSQPASAAAGRRARAGGRRAGHRHRGRVRLHGPAPAGSSPTSPTKTPQELTIIDTRTDSAVATIPVGTRPRGVRVSRGRQDDLRRAERLAQVPADHARRGVREAQGRQEQGRDRGGGRGQPEGDAGAARRLRPRDLRHQPRRHARCSSPTRTPARPPSWTSPAARSARR